MCDIPQCKSNDEVSFFYCPECLKINFPQLDIEDLYEMYAQTMEVVEWLIEVESYPEREDILPPEIFRERVFAMYNDLILKKQAE